MRLWIVVCLLASGCLPASGRESSPPASDEAEAFSANPCKQYIDSALPGSPVAISAWDVRAVKGDYLALFNVSTASTVRRTKLSNQAVQCALDGSYGMATQPLYANASFRDQLSQLGSWRQQLLAGDSVPAISANMATVSANLKAVYVANLQGAYTNTHSSVTGLCKDLDSAAGNIANDVIFIDNAEKAADQAEVLKEFCSDDNQKSLTKLADGCVNNDKFCDLSDLYDSAQDCQDFKSYQPGAPVPGTLGDLVSKIESYKTKLPQAKTECTGFLTSLENAWTAANL